MPTSWQMKNVRLLTRQQTNSVCKRLGKWKIKSNIKTMKKLIRFANTWANQLGLPTSSQMKQKFNFKINTNDSVCQRLRKWKTRSIIKTNTINPFGLPTSWQTEHIHLPRRQQIKYIYNVFAKGIILITKIFLYAL